MPLSVHKTSAIFSDFSREGATGPQFLYIIDLAAWVRSTTEPNEGTPIGDRDGGMSPLLNQSGRRTQQAARTRESVPKEKKKLLARDMVKKIYTVAIPLVQNLSLISKQKFGFGLARTGQAKAELLILSQREVLNKWNGHPVEDQEDS